MKTFKQRAQISSEMALQITSMADIFMILLVFLLKSYSTSLTNITPTAETKLPQATTGLALRESLKVEVTPSAILVDSKPAARLQNFTALAQDFQENGLFPNVYKALMVDINKQKNKDANPNLLLIADQRAPYGTLKGVIASAAAAGFVNLQLVVVREGE